MKLRQYEKEWQGLKLNQLSIGSGNVPAGARFYEKFYERLYDRERDEVASMPLWDGRDKWLQQKRNLGILIVEILKHNGITPGPETLLLSLGAGQGIVEETLLSAGYRVDLQDCQGASLQVFRLQHPRTRALVSDARRPGVADGVYNAVCCVALEYVFDDHDYSAVFSEMWRVLKPGGMAVVVSVSNLSLRHVMLGWARKLRDTLLDFWADRKAIWWGYLRTMDEHIRTAIQGGFSVEECVALDPENGILWRRRPTRRDRVLAFAKCSQLMLVCKKPTVFVHEFDREAAR